MEKKSYNYLQLFSLLFVIFLNSETSIAQVTELIKRESIAAVPDAPAFNALGGEPSNLLRPSNIRSLALDIAPFIQSGKFTLPRQFALEVSPGALIYRDRYLNISDYKANNVFLAYNTTLSIGTSVDENNGLNKIAIGWRTTFINKGDKFLDDKHRARIDNILQAAASKNTWETFKRAHATEFKSEGIVVGGKIDVMALALLESDEASLGIDSGLVKQYRLENTSLSDAQKIIDKADKEFEKANWNALRFDVAAAFVAVAMDSMGKNIKADKLHAWVTLSVPFTKYGQFVIGGYGNAGFDKAPTNVDGTHQAQPFEFGLSSRIYAGVNKYKFFTEAQIGYKQGGTIKHWATNHFTIGTEVGIYNLAWVSLFGGIKDIGVKQNGVSVSAGYFQFNWKLTIPDWVKFRN